MEHETHDAATAHMPFFVSPPGEMDPLMLGLIIFLLASVFLIGVFYLHLHALPERMAHSANSTQLQLVGILTLLALFTHNHLFWIAALLLVAIQFPDFSTPLNSIARSLQKLSGTGPPDHVEPQRQADTDHVTETESPRNA